MEDDVTLRITVVQPPRGVAFRVQEGRDGLLPPAHEDPGALSFDFALRAVEGGGDGAPVFRGPFAQGRPADRFVYVTSGTRAGQAGSCWARRAKVPLAGITREMVLAARARPGVVLEARIAGTARDGGPACATVPLLDGGWKVMPGEAPARTAPDPTDEATRPPHQDRP